jgi:hypothetical protein
VLVHPIPIMVFSHLSLHQGTHQSVLGGGSYKVALNDSSFPSAVRVTCRVAQREQGNPIP